MINSVVLVGRLTKDPQVTMTPNGKKVVRFTLAVNRDKDNTDFINCTAWEQRADLISQYLHKGSQAGIEGRLQSRIYDDPNYAGRKVFATEVLVQGVTFLDSKSKEEPATDSQPIEPFGDDLPF